MSVVHVPKERGLELRLLIVPLVLCGVLTAYLTRLWFLQVVMSEDLREKADTSGLIPVTRLAPRGKIVDRAGRLVGGVAPTFVVTAQPRTTLKNREALELVASILRIEPEALRKAIAKVSDSGDIPVPVYIGADVAAASEIAERHDEMPGFAVETQAMRYYTEPVLTGQLTGYVRVAGENDLKRLHSMGILNPAQYVGIAGLERQYEKLLMGSPGTEQVAVDARRRPLRSLGSLAPIAGSTLNLTLDMKLQSVAMNLLAGKRGSIVALDPRNGEVLCMASSPSYDVSMFQNAISKEDYKSLLDDPSKPMFFRATGAAYAPGSTFKVVTTIAAWLSGRFNPNTFTFCPGYIQVGTRKTKCLGKHGSISYNNAFAKSCNTYFGHLAVVAGRDNMLKACELLGLGKKTGLDLPAESSGIVPTPDWWDKKRDRRWALGDLVNFGMGQGELATTPLQMACALAAIANKGVSYRPHLLRSVTSPVPGAKPVLVEPVKLGEVSATDEQWQLLFRALNSVITDGTARSVAQISGLNWGGKTGSAENRKDHETHSWFIGMAPLEQPEIVICVMVENAGHGSDVAAPIATKCVKHWLVDRARSPEVQ